MLFIPEHFIAEHCILLVDDVSLAGPRYLPSLVFTEHVRTAGDALQLAHVLDDGIVGLALNNTYSKH